MKPFVKYGLMYGLLPAIVSLIIFSLGMSKDESAMTSMRWISLAIYCAVVFLGIRADRDEFRNGFISFGQAFGTGFKIVVIGAVIGAIMSFLYFTAIDPTMVDYIRLMQEEEMLERGMSQEEVDKMMPQMAKWTSVPMMVMFSLISGILIGCVITLISSAILKKEDPNAMVG